MLTKPLAVMVNRGGESLHTDRIAASTIGWPTIGEDPEDIVICDAGSAMVGFGFKVKDEHLLTRQCCSQKFVEDVDIVINPASEMEVVPARFNDSIVRAAGVHGLAGPAVTRAVTRSREGEKLSFYDVNGNLVTLTQEPVRVQAGAAAARRRTLLARRGIQAGAGGNPDNPAPLIGLTLLI
jgi:hypothetical protein